MPRRWGLRLQSLCAAHASRRQHTHRLGRNGQAWAKALSTSGGHDGGDRRNGLTDRDRIRKRLLEDPESPRNRRLNLDAKFRVLRILDKIHREAKGHEEKDIATHSLFSRLGRAQSQKNLTYDEFLLADADGNGRVSNAEWEAFVEKKARLESGLSYESPNALNIEIPMSTLQLQEMASDNEGLHISVNGMRYRLCLEPEGKTKDVIAKKQAKLNETLTELAKMERDKRPLDAKAARHTKRVLTVGLLYLLSQAGVIAKLTFFSRFGWDVMEPITYFITFGTAVMGFMFFQYHKIEYSYPALAALLTRRRASKLYKRFNFDIDRYTDLQAKAIIYEKQLLVLQPPQALWPTLLLEEDADAHLKDE